MLLNEDVEMSVLDFSPLTRSFIGFDHLFDLLQSSMGERGEDETYPSYNVERTGEDSYRISLAVAGFRPEELSITSEPGVVTISGKKSAEQQGDYLYQGIAARAFQRRFNLADYVKVIGASMENGLLTVDLVREVPEAMKPRKIVIANGSKPQQIEGKRAAWV